VEDSCEHGNEPSGFIKCWEVLEWLRDWRSLKEGLSSMKFLYAGLGSLSKSYCTGEVASNRNPYPLVTGYGAEGWNLVIGVLATASRPTPVAPSSESLTFISTYC
jgi:hypothetical protein